MATQVGIINTALTFMGSDLITSVTENTERRRTATAIYDDIRDATIRAYPWNFAKRRITLAPLSASPDSDWEYAFQKPSDCLRILGTYPSLVKYDVEGDTIVCNEDVLRIKYLARVEDPTKYDALFVQAFSARLAHAMAYRRVQSSSRESELWGLYKAILKEARSVDAQEGLAETVEVSEWVDSRASGWVESRG